MRSLRRRAVIVALGWLLAVGGCTGMTGDTGAGAGGTRGSGGDAGGTGGAPATGGRTGAGGEAAGTGGVTAAGTGGSNSAGTGGSNATGTGGSNGAGTGGTTRAGTGGNNGTGTGGTSGTGGSATGTGGANATGAGGASACGALDPATASIVSGYMDKLPYGPPKKVNDPPQTGDARYPLIDAIVKACAAFGPPPASTPGWQQQDCWAHLTAAIDKESSYNAASVVTDTYATRTINAAAANDPTVGLLQIRFSSTVHDYAVQGPAASLACVGCVFPASFATHKNDSGGGNSDFWAVSGPSANLALMQSIPCNVGLGAWYYYTYATGNGNPTTVTYLSTYCQGRGTAANLITGLRSHLEGPDGGKGVLADMAAVTALMTADSNAYNYVTQIKSWFDSMVGPVTGTHPFFVPLSPNPPQYCSN